MAVLLRTPSLLSRSSSPPSSSSYSLSSPFQHPLSFKSTHTRLNRPNLVTVTANRHHGGYALKAALDESPVLDPPPTAPGCEEDIATLKFKLLSIVSGLNRGLAASETDLSKADSAAKDLEAAGGLVDLSNDLDKLQGRWKLIYSSAFSSRTLGGSRPGPPTGRLLPITLGQVFQRIDVLGKDFDNIVELEFATPWPLPKAEATATLAHKFELIGCAKIKITFVSTTVKPTGSLSQLPPIEIPRIPDQFRPPSNTGSGEFEVTYVDSDTRITRGDKGELRVFVIS